MDHGTAFARCLWGQLHNVAWERLLWCGSTQIIACLSIISGAQFLFIGRAGLPITVVSGGTSLVTTAPMPTTA